MENSNIEVKICLFTITDDEVSSFFASSGTSPNLNEHENAKIIVQVLNYTKCDVNSRCADNESKTMQN